MAKKQQSNRKKCACGARVFQGPYYRGEIVDGELAVRETLYQCVHCHTVQPLDAIGEEVLKQVEPEGD